MCLYVVSVVTNTQIIPQEMYLHNARVMLCYWAATFYFYTCLVLQIISLRIKFSLNCCLALLLIAVSSRELMSSIFTVKRVMTRLQSFMQVFASV